MSNPACDKLVSFWSLPPAQNVSHQVPPSLGGKPPFFSFQKMLPLPLDLHLRFFRKGYVKMKKSSINRLLVSPAIGGIFWAIIPNFVAYIKNWIILGVWLWFWDPFLSSWDLSLGMPGVNSHPHPGYISWSTGFVRNCKKKKASQGSNALFKKENSLRGLFFF